MGILRICWLGRWSPTEKLKNGYFVTWWFIELITFGKMFEQLKCPILTSLNQIQVQKGLEVSWKANRTQPWSTIHQYNGHAWSMDIDGDIAITGLEQGPRWFWPKKKHADVTSFFGTNLGDLWLAFGNLGKGQGKWKQDQDQPDFIAHVLSLNRCPFDACGWHILMSIYFIGG